MGGKREREREREKEVKKKIKERKWLRVRVNWTKNGEKKYKKNENGGIGKRVRQRNIRYRQPKTLVNP